MWRSRESLKWTVITVVVASLSAAFGSLAIVLATDDGDSTPPATPSAEPATETATPDLTPPPPTPPPAPTMFAEPREVPRVQQDAEADALAAQVGAVVEADPVRVYTGDGDCLNVRPQPGTTFEAQPYSCVPEGTLLWLAGDPVAADGETWRYALGAGWIATQYTRPAEAPAIDTPGRFVTLWQMGNYRDMKAGDEAWGNDVHVARVDVVTGEVVARATFQGFGGGLGGRNPEISPSGRYIAFNRTDPSTGFATTLVGSVEDGTAVELPGFPQGWSAEDNLLVTVQDCDGYTCVSDLRVYDPRTGSHSTLVSGFSGVLSAWLPGGDAVLLIAEDLTVTKVALDGTSIGLGELPAGGASLWNAVPSPGGDMLFSPNDIQNVHLTDIVALTVKALPRAPQRELPGKCGGTWSSVVGWLDEETVFYHERSSSNGQDGITVMDVNTGERRVLPFFNAQDISSPDDGVLSFASWSYGDGGTISAVTFVLDVSTGDFVPLFAGSGAVWTS